VSALLVSVSDALARPLYSVELIERVGRFVSVRYETPGLFAPDAVVCLDDSAEGEAFNTAIRRLQYTRGTIIGSEGAQRRRIAAATRALMTPLLRLDPLQGEAALVLRWVRGLE